MEVDTDVSEPVGEPERDLDCGSLNLSKSVAKLFLSDDISDVSFIFPNEDNQRLPAHRFLLSARSSVFRTMFYGSMPEKGEVPLPNISLTAFRDFLKYLYTDRIELNSVTVTELLYISHMYGVKCLTNICEEYLQENLGVDNACTVFAQASFFSLEVLKSEALLYIEFHAQEVLQSSDFKGLPKECLSTLLDSDRMKATEADIVAAVLRWVDVQSTKTKNEQNKTDKRAILGDMFYKLRIPCLSLSEFSETLAEKGILTDAEELQFYRYFSKKSSTAVILKFPNVPRGGEIPERVEIKQYFQEGNRNDRLTSGLEVLKFSCKGPSKVIICELSFLDASQTSKLSEGSLCKFKHKLVRIKIKGKKGNMKWEDILETTRCEKVGNVKTDITIEPNQPYTLDISIKKVCECCSSEPFLSYRQITSSVQTRFDGLSSRVYPTKEIAKGLHLQLEGYHMVKSIRITKS